MEGALKPVYFEDLVEGHVEESSELIVDRDEMVAYAERNDPYLIHVDEQFAAASPYGGLIASFGYTVSLYFRMIHDIEQNRAAESTTLGALEWRVTFRGPIRPGDHLHIRETTSSKRLASTGNRGVVTSRNEVLNQHDEVPITIEVVWLIATRQSRS
jgi:acyl dehydratase